MGRRPKAAAPLGETEKAACKEQGQGSPVFQYFRNIFDTFRPFFGITGYSQDPRVRKAIILLHLFYFSEMLPMLGKSPFHSSLNIMLRVSFSPDRDRARLHCWISTLQNKL